MSKYPAYLISLLILAATFLPSCSDDDNDTATVYAEWREANDAWLLEQQMRTDDAGNLYFKQVVPQWDPSAYVLIHYFNDRTETEGNLSPMLTSSIDTRYYVTYYDGTPLDSSYRMTTYGPGIFRTQLDEVITGWTIAFEDMRVGDTAEVIIPYQQAYGVSTSSNVPPYTNLKYNVKLVDIVAYEKNPWAVE